MLGRKLIALLVENAQYCRLASFVNMSMSICISVSLEHVILSKPLNL